MTSLLFFSLLFFLALAYRLILRRVNIASFISDHLPAWCVRCRYLMFAKNARWHRTTAGVSVALCQKCEKELYRPMEGK